METRPRHRNTWRGANVENILSFPDRHPGTQIHRIETNYRSTPQILAFANGVLLAQPKGRAFEKELRPHRANSEKPYLVQAMDTREQAQFIVQRMPQSTAMAPMPSAQAPIVIATMGDTLHGKLSAEMFGATKKMAPTARKASPPLMVSQRAREASCQYR